MSVFRPYPRTRKHSTPDQCRSPAHPCGRYLGWNHNPLPPGAETDRREKTSGGANQKMHLSRLHRDTAPHVAQSTFRRQRGDGPHGHATREPAASQSPRPVHRSVPNGLRDERSRRGSETRPETPSRGTDGQNFNPSPILLPSRGGRQPDHEFSRSVPFNAGMTIRGVPVTPILPSERITVTVHAPTL